MCNECFKELRAAAAAKTEDMPPMISLMVVAALIRVAGAGSIVLGIVYFFKGMSEIPSSTPEVASGGAMVLAGIFELAFGEALEALRAIARNSFRR